MSRPSVPISKRALSVTPSATLAITAKAKEMKAKGIDVISLAAGEPDFDTPSFIKEAAVDALKKGATKYTAVAGIPELRKAIAAKLKRDQGLTFDPSQIVVTVGAKHALFNVLFALLNDGDEAAVPSPYWLSYPEMVTVLGGRNRFLETTEATGFKLTPEILKKGLSGKTRVLFLNSPSNPTGAVTTREEWTRLLPVLRDFPGVTLVSDEIYEKLIFDGLPHVSIASLDPEIAKRTVVINGHSKAYAMTGWRLGYAACPDPELAQAVAGIQSHSTSNATAFVQAGGVAALEKGEAEAARMRGIFEKRRDFFYGKIAAIPRLEPFRPSGAFYLFVDIRETGMDSMTFCTRLLEEARVAAVPGKPFGSDAHVRMSFACSEDELGEAARRISSWLENVHQPSGTKVPRLR